MICEHDRQTTVAEREVQMLGIPPNYVSQTWSTNEVF